MSSPWTAAQIIALLDRDNLAVERAVVAIFNRQTDDEQASDTTRHRNGRGFNAFDAGRGGYYARWILSGRSLSGTHLDRARRMVKRYVGQLQEIAQGRVTESREVAHV